MLDHITVFPAVRKVKGNDDHSLIEKTFLVNNIKVVMFPISSCLLNYQTKTLITFITKEFKGCELLVKDTNAFCYSIQDVKDVYAVIKESKWIDQP